MELDSTELLVWQARATYEQAMAAGEGPCQQVLSWLEGKLELDSDQLQTLLAKLPSQYRKQDCDGETIRQMLNKLV